MKRLVFNLVLVLAIVLLVSSCQKNQHFMTNCVYRTLVHRDFLKQQELAQGRAEALFDGMDTLCREEREALEFLYAYMPYSDLADYDQAFYLQQIRTAFAARDTFSWGRQVPEDIFRHYVLAYRAYDENLDTARVVFFRELKDRVKNLPMDKAALEVNHWCHEHVSFLPSEPRTESPLVTVKSSFGHCVDESAFAIMAMRAVGIPARQCYTPRWTHNDGAHFWPEVWVIDSAGHGEWHYLGACEPMSELDLTWMDTCNGLRMIMVNSIVFGRYKGPEEMLTHTNRYSLLNILDRYVPTRKVTVTVMEPGDNGRMRPAKNASVKFKVYNLGKYSPVASISTNKRGKAKVSIGLGDVMVWANKNGMYNYRKMDVRQQDTLTIVLNRDGNIGQAYIEEVDMVPPIARGQRSDGKDVRFDYEDSLRNSYMATFPTMESYKEYLPEGWRRNAEFFGNAQVGEILQLSAGNYEEIIKFLVYCAEQGRTDSYIYDYLMSYSKKDLRDITAEVLEDHLTDPRDYSVNYEVYKKGIMPGHVSDEMVRPWRHQLAEVLKNIKTAEELKSWTEENVVLGNGNHYHCPISPYGLYQLRHSDKDSRDIFYVAACRALGIPAYLDKTMNTLYVWNNGWHEVSFNSRPIAKAKLVLVYHDSAQTLMDTPKYDTNYTLQRYVNGNFYTLESSEDHRLDTLPAMIELDADGYYCLCTGSRCPDGKAITRMEFFTLNKESDNVKKVIFRPLTKK